MPERPTSDAPRDPATTPRAAWAYGLLTTAVVFGLFASGGPLQVTQGVMAVITGLSLIFFPPTVALPRWWWVLGGGVIALGALAFLPREWGYNPEWRRHIDALGVPTGGHITAHPAVSFQHWVRLVVTVGIGLWILGHRLTDRGQALVMLAVAWATGVYAALSIFLDGRAERWAWDPVESFGLFANRSHTATLLVIGLLAALTVAVYHIRHGRGGRAALATLPGMACAAALLGYSVSRAGLLLLGLGLAAWVAGMVKRKWSPRTAVTVACLVAAVAGLFWISNAEIKSRLLRATPQATAPSLGAIATTADAAPTVELDLGVQDDGRWLIFSDTFDLIRDSWLTGIGRGMFEHVIPQYRQRSACESRCLHPESDWLLFASETGVPCALALVALVGAVAIAAMRSAWNRRGWSLRWGGLVAALILPIHGIFDTPGHLPVLELLTLLLTAAAFRPPSGMNPLAGTAARSALRATGLLAVAAGAWSLRAESTGRPTPVVVAPLAINEAAVLYRDDQLALAAAKMNAAAESSPTPVPEAPDDRLRRAIAVVEKALRTNPLDTTLHYQRGMLALHFDELDAVADQAFAVQRLLEPMPPGVALRQAQGWAAVDPVRAASLWANARLRAAETARVSSWVHPGVANVDAQILAQAKASEDLMRLAEEVLNGTSAAKAVEPR